jgi:hypothetical protein
MSLPWRMRCCDERGPDRNALRENGRELCRFVAFACGLILLKSVHMA